MRNKQFVGLETFEDERAYLPGAGVNGDQGGRSPGWRLGHCTPVRLKPASSPNRWTSGAEFVVVGVAYARPSYKFKDNISRRMIFSVRVVTIAE